MLGATFHQIVKFALTYFLQKLRTFFFEDQLLFWPICNQLSSFIFRQEWLVFILLSKLMCVRNWRKSLVRSQIENHDASLKGNKTDLFCLFNFLNWYHEWTIATIYVSHHSIFLPTTTYWNRAIQKNNLPTLRAISFLVDAVLSFGRREVVFGGFSLCLHAILLFHVIFTNSSC